MKMEQMSRQRAGTRSQLAGANHQRARRNLGQLGRILTVVANFPIEENDTLAEVLIDTVANYSGRYGLRL